jgi:nucleoside-diphosphate-sugar epimerase
MMDLFCFGAGYTAAALGRLIADRPDVVIGGTRRIATGPDVLAFDGRGHSADIARCINRATHVLVSVPPDDAGCPVHRWFGDDIAASPTVEWIGYLSTIGVYGDTGGAWIDETAPLNPTSERALRRVKAEAAWLALGAAAGKHVDLFRLPGIYGPGRSAIDSVRDGTAKRIIKSGQVFNRIHVDDIAGALDCAMARPITAKSAHHQIYNVTDDEPAPPQDVIVYAATLLGMAPPPETPFAEARLSEMAASFYAENKRVANARLKEALGYTLRYPTYREGLAAIAKDAARQA